MNYDDDDSSILALLAASDEEDVMPSRELPPSQVWSENALVDAWSAAMAEFKVGAGASPSGSSS